MEKLFLSNNKPFSKHHTKVQTWWHYPSTLPYIVVVDVEFINDLSTIFDSRMLMPCF